MQLLQLAKLNQRNEPSSSQSQFSQHVADLSFTPEPHKEKFNRMFDKVMRPEHGYIITAVINNNNLFVSLGFDVISLQNILTVILV